MTFYESSVVLERCRLVNSIAQDVIHVSRAQFEFYDTEFAKASANAFDGDWTQGRIERCAFHAG